jgi:hypothetical protein
VHEQLRIVLPHCPLPSRADPRGTVREGGMPFT